MRSEKLAYIGKTFPSEKKVTLDQVTGHKLIFLTAKDEAGDSKIYPTHNQWTSDGEWIIFRSRRSVNEAMAVHEKSGKIVQITQGGFEGMLLVARKSMTLYFFRPGELLDDKEKSRNRKVSLFSVDLESLFQDVENQELKSAEQYQQKVTEIPEGFEADLDMALDANEQQIYFRTGAKEAEKHLSPEIPLEPSFGPRGMGQGPSGIASLKISTGEITHILSTPFQMGHIQANPWRSEELIFCWETGGKAPQRTWLLDARTGEYREIYKESSHEWVTHEAIIGPDEVAFAIMGHRPISSADLNPDAPGNEPDWGPCGTRGKPSGLAVMNIRSREMSILSQIPYGSGFWHVHGSSDGKWAVGDNFKRELFLIDRRTGKRTLLSAGHKESAADHTHPTFSPDGRKINIQSAMLSEDGKSMGICVIPIDTKDKK